MNDEIDHGIDRLLCDQFDGPVEDAGFCDRVVGQLPARRRRRGWPLIAASLFGVAMSWASLWSASIFHAGWHDWISGQLSASASALLIAMMAMAMLALTWVIAEADDYHPASPRRVIR